MEESINIKKIAQKVNQASQQDGIIEIFVGIFFLYYLNIFADIIKGVKTDPAVIVFFILICNFPILYLKFIRSWFTYPRMGYVNIKEKITRVYTITVILPMILLPVFMYIVLRFFRDSLDIDLILRWMSVIFGLVFGALFYDFAKKYGKRIYYFLTAFSVVAGLVLSLITLDVPGVGLLILMNCLIVLFHGVFMLIRFFIKYPKPKKQETFTMD